MAPDSTTLAWRIPWMEEPGRLQSMVSRRVGHDWATSLSLFTFLHWRRKWQPTPVFLPGESQGWQSLAGCRLWGCTESDRTSRIHFCKGHCLKDSGFACAIVTAINRAQFLAYMIDSRSIFVEWMKKNSGFRLNYGGKFAHKHTHTHSLFFTIMGMNWNFLRCKA